MISRPAAGQPRPSKEDQSEAGTEPETTPAAEKTEARPQEQETTPPAESTGLQLPKRHSKRRVSRSSRRPRDVIDAIEEICAVHGHVEPVDEEYYDDFLKLNQQEIERLAVAVMLDHEKEVRRLAARRLDPAAIERVARLVENTFVAISIGLERCDAFGRLGFVARVGSEPSAEMSEALAEKRQMIEPIITNMVRLTLPWLLSREISQGQLPL
jgi:vacuolar-type H+-ATPase subunit H